MATKTTRSRPTRQASVPRKRSPPRKAEPAPQLESTHTPLALPPIAEASLKALARQLQSWTSSVLGMAGTATDLGVTLAKARLKKPQHKAAVEKAGSLLHELREAAGLTVHDLGTALGLNDASEVELIESGKVAMPFELILRAASVLGRKDPITFVMQFTRAYNPDMWRTLENLGIGKLVVQGAREREFANIYRAHDAGRALTDEQFAQALAFVNAAFELALGFMGKHKRVPGAKKEAGS